MNASGRRFRVAGSGLGGNGGLVRPEMLAAGFADTFGRRDVMDRQVVRMVHPVTDSAHDVVDHVVVVARAADCVCSRCRLGRQTRIGSHLALRMLCSCFMRRQG